MKSITKGSCKVCYIPKKKNPNGTMYADGPVKWRKVKDGDVCSGACSREYRMLRNMDNETATA